MDGEITSQGELVNRVFPTTDYHGFACFDGRRCRLVIRAYPKNFQTAPEWKAMCKAPRFLTHPVPEACGTAVEIILNFPRDSLPDRESIFEGAIFKAPHLKTNHMKTTISSTALKLILPLITLLLPLANASELGLRSMYLPL